MARKLVLAVVMVCLLAGGGLFASGKGEAGPGAGPKHLTIWHAYAGQADKVEFMKWAMDTFKKMYPEIGIDEVPMEHSAYKVKLDNAMSAGTAPDVFYTLPGGYLGAFVKGGQVASLDKAFAADPAWKSSIMESALARVTYNGSVYAVPIDADETVVWYNKALFKAKGWQEPQTWDAFVALCASIKSSGVIPIALGNKDSWPSTFWFQYPMLRLVGTGVVDRFNAADPKASFYPEGVRAFQVIHDLAQAGYFPEGVNGMSDGEANMLFLNAKAAMVLNGTWQIGMTADAPKDFELGYFPFPTFKDGVGTQTDIIAGVAACFGMSKSCKDVDSAVKFLKFMTSKEAGAKYVEIRKTLVTTKGAVTEQNAGPVLYSISKLMEKAASLDAFYDTAMPPAATQAYYTALQGVIGLTTSPDDAAKALDAAMKAGK